MFNEMTKIRKNAECLAEFSLSTSDTYMEQVKEDEKIVLKGKMSTISSIPSGTDNKKKYMPGLDETIDEILGQMKYCAKEENTLSEYCFARWKHEMSTIWEHDRERARTYMQTIRRVLGINTIEDKNTPESETLNETTTSKQDATDETTREKTNETATKSNTHATGTTKDDSDIREIGSQQNNGNETENQTDEEEHTGDIDLTAEEIAAPTKRNGNY